MSGARDRVMAARAFVYLNCVCVCARARMHTHTLNEL